MTLGPRQLELVTVLELKDQNPQASEVRYPILLPYKPGDQIDFAIPFSNEGRSGLYQVTKIDPDFLRFSLTPIGGPSIPDTLTRRIYLTRVRN